METLKSYLKYLKENIHAFVKWLVIAVVTGLCCGGAGVAFCKCIGYVTDIRTNNEWLIFLLPIGGIVIAFVYQLFKAQGALDTDRVFASVSGEGKIPFVLAPLVFFGTVVTHLFGGSAGRVGASLQIGGSLGYNLGKILGLNKKDIHIITMSGMSAVFATLFGTPIAAAFFAMEAVCVGIMRYSALVPCVISSVVAYCLTRIFSLPLMRFTNIAIDAVGIDTILRVIVLALLCALISILFCVSIKKSKALAKKIFENVYIRSIAGALIIVALTLLLGTKDYNGAGMAVIERAMQGEAKWEAFLLKMIFTSITMAVGFRGGEITPAFFIGSTFGCVAGPLLGIDASFGAAIGLISVFCGATNCPVASMMMAIEVFGTNNIFLFAIACAISYMMSGRVGLYKEQKFAYSKLNDDVIDC